MSDEPVGFEPDESSSFTVVTPPKPDWIWYCVLEFPHEKYGLRFKHVHAFPIFTGN